MNEEYNLNAQRRYETVEHFKYFYKRSGGFCPEQYKQSRYNQHYVYLVVCKDTDELIYVGSGKGERWKHTLSGASHNRVLNEMVFKGRNLEVLEFMYQLTKEDSLKIEAGLIAFYNPVANVVGKTKMLYRKDGKSPYDKWCNDN